MDQIRCFTFERGNSPQRLDQFLADCLPDLSRSHIKKLIEEGQILCDGASVKAGSKLRGGEEIQIEIPPPEPIEALPEDIPLDILFEDPYLIVINKPAGMVVHPAPGHGSGTLVNALLHHCRDLSGIGGSLRPGIVHRLDKDTSGVMVVTKDDATHQGLARQFKEHTISRRYVALVFGHVQNATGTVDKPIGRHPQERKKMSGASRAGRRAVTHWEVLQRFDRDRLTYIELTLETGRTHQIRVHLSEMNLPVVGDPVYGGQKKSNAIGDSGLRSLIQGLKRQALHARLLGFVHPVTGERVEFSSPLPNDMAAILTYLNNKYDADPGHQAMD
ncbi:MAG: RluA family pseudouridine synthase [Desulfuromonas sp.]|nr:MAG: RluA family pseudouridine synthase [Desulfuromonas sp.]